MTGQYLLEARSITKKFGDFAANDNVTLELSPGKIHALLGENGAGKSTLVKIIYGSLQPTAGNLLWHGDPVTIQNPAEARQMGIGMVFQHFSLFEALTVAENIALALPGDFSIKNLSKRISTVSKDYGLPLEPGALVADLSVGERQRIEIIRCLLQEPRLLILDEPTAVLTPQEADQLFVTLKRLADEGCSILYISHRLEEVKRLCHGATILRHGKVIAEVNPEDESAASLARHMVGHDVHTIDAKKSTRDGSTLIEINNLSLAASGPFGVALKNINLTVNEGEVVAIAGVAGNGQSEFFDALSGERRANSPDAVVFCGENVGNASITERRGRAAAFVAEERLGHGAVPGLPLSDNVILTRHASDHILISKGLIKYDKAHEMRQRISEDFDIRKNKADPEARSLSGGNLQKFVVGRELDRTPKMLIVNQPTWGVDAGAAALIRQALVDLASNGSAVLVISQDLDEIFEIADRIAVISRGQLSDATAAFSLSMEKIGLLMAGAHESHATDDLKQGLNS